MRIEIKGFRVESAVDYNGECFYEVYGANGRIILVTQDLDDALDFLDMDTYRENVTNA